MKGELLERLEFNSRTRTSRYSFAGHRGVDARGYDPILQHQEKTTASLRRRV